MANVHRLQRRSPRKPTAIPPLVAGDRLSLAEFRRRAEALPPEKAKHVELLDGEVYIMPPIKAEHSQPHGLVNMWLGKYSAATPG